MQGRFFTHILEPIRFHIYGESIFGEEKEMKKFFKEFCRLFNENSSHDPLYTFLC